MVRINYLLKLHYEFEATVLTTNTPVKQLHQLAINKKEKKKEYNYRKTKTSANV